ncbi:MAG: phosphotransferase [Chloroflexota bacterium]
MTRQSERELLARGRTAEVYAWADNQILKLFFDWCPPEWIQAEVQVGRLLASTSLPTPRLMETISLEGRQGIIFDRVEGPSMLSLLGTSPWLLSRAAHQFAELHSAIHAITSSNLPSLHSHLRISISTTDLLPALVRDHALAALISLPDGHALCHFDFHPDQVALTRQGPMILDWMTARRGHPLADVARTSILIAFAQAPYANWLMRTATDLVRKAFRSQYLRRYAQLHPGFRLDDLHRWMVPVAAARIAENVPGEHDQILAFLEHSLVHPMAA